jgi:hypothetical protein
MSVNDVQATETIRLTTAAELLRLRTEQAKAQQEYDHTIAEIQASTTPAIEGPQAGNA